MKTTKGIKKKLLNYHNVQLYVVWGKNLTSQVGSGRYTKQVSEMIQYHPFNIG